MKMMGVENRHAAASHGDMHNHEPVRAASKALYIALVLNSLFVVVEAVAGWKADSLALLSDAGHNFTDVLALILAAFGVYLHGRPGDEARTYGYQRAGVLAAFVNSLVLIVLAGFVFYESYDHLVNPHPVPENVLIVVAAIGLVVNLSIAWALGGHHHDLNIRAAWIHMAGDAGASLAIIAGAVVMRYTGWHQIDPILSMLIGVAIVWTAWGIIRDSLNILLEGLPKGVTLPAVNKALSQVPGVIDVHDLHIWSLGSRSHALSCHVLIDDMPPSASESILRNINEVLCDKFAIRHSTVQFEHVSCGLAETHCTVQDLASHPATEQHEHKH
jgi:cobalt-zinc-cadmium efflux system protein